MVALYKQTSNLVVLSIAGVLMFGQTGQLPKAANDNFPTLPNPPKPTAVSRPQVQVSLPVKTVSTEKMTAEEPEVGDVQSSAGQTKLRYVNKGAIRNRRLTQELEAKLKLAVSAILGPGHTVEVFSGGQPKKGTSKRRKGSTRHDDHGHGGRAADVYIYGPDGKKVRDKNKLLKLHYDWVSQGYGSSGAFMSDFGLHLDQITKDQLSPGQGLIWKY